MTDTIHKTKREREKLNNYSIESNMGGEFLIERLEKYLKENGMVHETTMSFTLMQNGVAE